METALKSIASKLILACLALAFSACSLLASPSHRAYLACTRNDFDEAAVQYRLALKDSPKDECLLGNFIHCLTRAKRFQAAQPFVKQLVALPPTTAFSFRTLGKYFYYRKSYSKALQYFKKAAAASPQGSDYYFMANALLRMDLDPTAEWNKASYYYQMESHSGENTNDAAFWSDYGYVLEQTGDCDKAKLMYQHALVLDPKNKRASARVKVSCD